MTENKTSSPNLNTLSVLLSSILLAYTLTHFVRLPVLEINLQLAGVYLPLRLNFPTLVTFSIAGLAASGTAWMLQEHPQIDRDQLTVEGWLLPGLTAFVLMLVLEQIPLSPVWWMAAAVSGLLLMLVFVAEYVAVDPGNEYYLLAEIGITALALSFFVIMAIALHAEEIRLFFRVPLLSLAAGLVFLRVLHLRLKGDWVFIPAVITSVVIGQLSAGYHYWPMNSISFGLALFGPLYALIDVGEKYGKKDTPLEWQGLIFPGSFLLLTWLVALII